MSINNQQFSKVGVFACIPWNNTLSFFRIRRTKVCYLSGFELCKSRFPSKRSKRDNKMEFQPELNSLKNALSNSTGRIRRVKLCKRLHIFKSFVIHAIQRSKYFVLSFHFTNFRCEETTHAVSGASLSRFSNKYLTSDINRQPALLNSGPSFRADASSSSIRGRWRSFADMKRLRQEGNLVFVLCHTPYNKHGSNLF